MKISLKFLTAVSLLFVTIISNASDKIMLFGNENNTKYLGCLTCSKYESDSVHNKYGQFGSKYNSDSIYNKYGQFGSKYSQYGACNPYASNPPVVVDESGGFYGYLSMNSNLALVENLDLLAWLKYNVCSD